MKPVAAVDLGGQFHGSVLSMVMDAGPMVQFVLLLLFIFSIVSWAIILMKYRTIYRVSQENEKFLDVYQRKNKLADIFPEAKKFVHSSLAEIFRVGYTELAEVAKAMKEATVAKTPEDPSKFEKGGLDNVERALNRACSTETTKLESALAFLATTGSACPFIGLFGTVWGIMDTFKGIGARGSATLAVVAPGISEALIATAAGLAAAIPAVIFYNYFLNRIKDLTLDMDNFAAEFLNLVERYTIKK